MLNSIDDNGAQTPTPPLQVARPQNTGAGQPAGQALIGPISAATAAPLNNKRKREDSLVESSGKHIKNGIGVERSSQAIISSAPRAVQSTSSSAKSPAPASNSEIPYRGSSRQIPAPGTSIPPIPVVAKAPKKGSYAEIMARAKAAEPKAAAVGVISHKPKEKTAISYKKEMKLRKKAAMNKKLGIRDDGKRPSSSGSISSSSAPAASERKKVPLPTYKGTAKPADPVKPARPQPTYKGTMKPGGSTAPKPKQKDRDGRPSKPRYDEYAATDEDDLDDAEEDEYGSDESEGMEAGFSDVEQEETIATRTARKEDEEEARLEARHKREKEDRKKRLEALSKKAKPTKY